MTPVTTDESITLFLFSMTKFEDANILYEAGTKAMKPSPYKYGTQLYEMNHLLETAKLQKAFREGTYKPQPGVKFEIKERGHERYITSTETVDKAVSHIVCDEYLTPLLGKYLQYDNSASQTGKGVAFHRKRFEVHLRQYYEKEGPMRAIFCFPISPATMLISCMRSHLHSWKHIWRKKSLTRKNWRKFFRYCGKHSEAMSWTCPGSPTKKSSGCTGKRSAPRLIWAFPRPP